MHKNGVAQKYFKSAIIIIMYQLFSLFWFVQFCQLEDDLFQLGISSQLLDLLQGTCLQLH